MATDRIMHQRIDGMAILLVVFGLAAGLPADEITVLPLKSPPAATKILSFPADQCMGNLLLEPESGPFLDPEAVCLSLNEQYFGMAQGNVRVPADRNIQLHMILAVKSGDASKLRVQQPLLYQVGVAERIRRDPEDLSGLLALDPNALSELRINSRMAPTGRLEPGRLEPLRHLTGLQVLKLSNLGITDQDLAPLTSLHRLKGLELVWEPRIGTRGMAILKALPALEYLDLPEGLTDAGLKEVANISSLRYLRVRTGSIWGPGLAALAKLPHLERLCIWGTSPISDRHIKYLEGLTQLKSLTLWGVCDPLADASLASIGKLKNLGELYFIRTTPQFTPAGAAHLRHLTNLIKVDFAQTKWGDPSGPGGDEVVDSLAVLPHLESAKGTGRLSERGMKTLGTMKNLKCLSVDLKDRGLGYSGPTGLAYLAGLESLEELSLGGCAATFSDADMVALESLSRLKDLTFGSRTATGKHLASIGKLRQLERLALGVPGLTCTELNQLNTLSHLHDLDVSAGGTAGIVTGKVDELTLDLSGLREMKDMNLTGVPLGDDDLAFLGHMPLLENLMIQPDGDSLTGRFLRYLQDLPELNRLYVTGLSDCSGEDLTHLNGLPKLRRLTLTGDITDSALTALTGPGLLESLRVDTDNPIRKQTVTDLTNSHPVMEYIRIREPTKIPTRPVPKK